MPRQNIKLVAAEIGREREATALLAGIAVRAGGDA